jgi:hypothetical protein
MMLPDNGFIFTHTPSKISWIPSHTIYNSIYFVNQQAAAFGDQGAFLKNRPLDPQKTFV